MLNVSLVRQAAEIQAIQTHQLTICGIFRRISLKIGFNEEIYCELGAVINSMKALMSKTIRERKQSEQERFSPFKFKEKVQEELNESDLCEEQEVIDDQPRRVFEGGKTAFLGVVFPRNRWNEPTNLSPQSVRKSP